MKIIFNPGFISSDKLLFIVLSVIVILMIAATFYLGIKESKRNDNQ